MYFYIGYLSGGSLECLSFLRRRSIKHKWVAMIIVNYKGRMGNNMFQYSLGRILAEEMGYYFHASAVDGFKKTNTTLEPTGEIVMAPEPIRLRGQHLEIDGQRVDIKTFLKRAMGQEVHLEGGFFQRYEHYKSYKDRIRKWFEIEDLNVGQTNNDIIIHLRMGDCILDSLAQDPYIMPFEYYDAALNATSFDRLYICSDPHTLDHSLFLEYMEKFSKYNPELLRGDQMEDFRAIKSFNKIIISQSTYSWWAAFLSKASEIFVPVPEPGAHRHEWSIASPGVALFVDDEESYKYIKQYKDGWKLVDLQDIEER